MTRIGIFELRDGVTPERAARFAKTIDAIDYPWRRIIPKLRTDPDKAVVVKWLDTGQGVTGLYYGRTIEIHLSERDWAADGEPFVIAHEVGHLVDHATFDRATRNAILRKYHTDLDGPYDGRKDPNDHSDDPAPFAWSHEVDHLERWVSSNDYQHRPNESYADSFVATFAPTIWDGTEFGVGQRWPRFAHWTNDYDAIRELTLAREITVYPDVPADHPLREEIERAAELGLLTGFSDGTFRPGEPLTRAQAAAVAVRQYDRITSEVTDNE